MNSQKSLKADENMYLVFRQTYRQSKMYVFFLLLTSTKVPHSIYAQIHQLENMRKLAYMKGRSFFRRGRGALAPENDVSFQSNQDKGDEKRHGEGGGHKF